MIGLSAATDILVLQNIFERISHVFGKNQFKIFFCKCTEIPVDVLNPDTRHRWAELKMPSVFEHI